MDRTCITKQADRKSLPFWRTQGMKLRKLLGALLLCAGLSLGLPVAVQAQDSTLQFGEGYTFDTITKTLTITAEEATDSWKSHLPTYNLDRSAVNAAVIGPNVTILKLGVLATCPNLTSVTFTEGGQLKTIGENAFFNSASLASIRLPDSLETIGENAFHGCSSLGSADLSGLSNLTSIGYRAFFNCSSLASLTLPGGVTSISRDAFYGCTALDTITVDPGNPDFEAQDNVLYNKGMTKLIHYAFKAGTAFTVPDTVTAIGEGAFAGCSELQSVVLPSGLEAIESMAFERCKKLTDVNLENLPNLTHIESSAFSNCFSLTEVNLASSTRLGSIGYGTFSDCKGITSVVLPPSLETIEGRAFEGCQGLTSIRFPSSLKEIADEVFKTCDNLKEITFTGEPPSINVLAFWGIPASGTLYYPAGQDVGKYVSQGLENWTKEARYRLTVVNGRDITAAGLYHAGNKTAAIEAIAPSPAHTFLGWRITEGTGIFSDATAAATTFTFGDPIAHATVTATYRSRASTPAFYSPTYEYRKLTDEATGIEVTGDFTNDAALRVSGHMPHDSGSCPACDEIRARVAAGDMLALHDIDMASGSYRGSLTVSIPVGPAQEGRVVELLHCNAKEPESQAAIVRNGRASGEFDSLSPFAVVSTGDHSVPDVPVSDSPQTGDKSNGLILGLSMLLLAAGLGALLARRRSRGFHNPDAR